MNDPVVQQDRDLRPLQVLSRDADIRQRKLDACLILQDVSGADAGIIDHDLPCCRLALALGLSGAGNGRKLLFEPVFAQLFLIGLRLCRFRADQRVDPSEQLLKKDLRVSRPEQDQFPDTFLEGIDVGTDRDLHVLAVSAQLVLQRPDHHADQRITRDKPPVEVVLVEIKEEIKQRHPGFASRQRMDDHGSLERPPNDVLHKQPPVSAHGALQRVLEDTDNFPAAVTITELQGDIAPEIGVLLTFPFLSTVDQRQGQLHFRLDRQFHLRIPE